MKPVILMDIYTSDNNTINTGNYCSTIDPKHTLKPVNKRCIAVNGEHVVKGELV